MELNESATICKEVLDQQQQKPTEAVTKKLDTKLQHLQWIIKKLITLIQEITKRFKSKYSLTTANKL